MTSSVPPHPAISDAQSALVTSPGIALRVLLRLRDGGPTTLSRLAKELELSRTSVEHAVNELLARGHVVEGHRAPARTAGRPARQYAFDERQGVVVGLDVGVHSLRAVLADLAGRVLAQHTFPGLDPANDGASQLGTVVGVVHAVLDTADVPRSKLRALGVALPGIVDDGGQVLASVVIPGWVGIDIGERLRRALGCDVVLDNGVRLAAIAEHHLGVARLADDVLYVSVGERIAMGLILDGRPRRGVHNLAGDVGRLAFRSVSSATGQINWSSGADAREVFELARSGDARAAAERTAFIDDLAHGLATLIMTVDPAMVVVGGGVSLAGDLLEPLRSGIAEALGLPVQIPVTTARLGADAAVHGAVIYAYSSAARYPELSDEAHVPEITPLATADAR